MFRLPGFPGQRDTRGEGTSSFGGQVVAQPVTLENEINQVQHRRRPSSLC